MQNNNLPTIIIGAGFAGLTAAYQLAKRGEKIIILEAAPNIGGRARTVSFGEERVDNGQHILVGAYDNTLNLLHALNYSEDSLFLRVPFKMIMHTDNSSLSIPMHSVLSFLFAKGLSVKDKFLIGSFIYKLKRNNFALSKMISGAHTTMIPGADTTMIKDHDISILDFLHHQHMPTHLTNTIFAPIALAALNTPIHIASTKLFLAVLKATFGQKSEHSCLLFPKKDLSEILPNPIARAIQTMQEDVFLGHNPILCRQRALTIEYHSQEYPTQKYHSQNTLHNKENYFLIRGHSNQHYQEWKAKSVIVATPPTEACKLLSLFSELSPLCQNLLQFSYQPITTLYLKYEKPVQMSYPIVGFANKTAHWIINRATCQNANMLSVVISGDGPHTAWDQNTLISTILKELNGLQGLQGLQNPIATKIITEKKATFGATVGVDKLRPSNKTAVPGLYLAGDYTDTGFPATLEGAVTSGIKASCLIEP